MKKYYNDATKEWYTSGQPITRKLENGALFSGVPSEEQLTAWGFREWIEPAPTPEQLLARAKEEKIAELMVYDESDAVNSFELLQNGVKIIDYWMKPDLRTSLEGDVIAFSKVQDYYNFDIRELGITLPLNCNKFLAALDDLKRYAVRSFNNTSLHLAAIQQLTSKEEVEAYDFTTGYPEKLSFDIVNLMSNE